MLPTFAVVRSKPRSSWLEGLILHTCGQRMYLITTTPTVRRGELPMFRCANRYKPERCRLPHAEASAKNVEAAARAAFLADRRAVRSVAEVWAALRSDDARSRVESRRAIIAKKRAAVETRRSNAEEMRLSGRRSYAWWAERDAAYAAELATLAAEEAALPDTIDRPTVERLAAALGEVDDRIPNDEIALAGDRRRRGSGRGADAVRRGVAALYSRARYRADLAEPKGLGGGSSRVPVPSHRTHLTIA
jgi:hypothetical protein